jgi:hypothetical protein
MPTALDAQATLERVFRFGPLELTANRAGQLSPAQRAHLTESARALERSNRSAHDMLVAVGVLGLAVAVGSLPPALGRGLPAKQVIGVFLVMALSSAGVLVWGVRGGAKAKAPVRFPERVETIEGEIRFEVADDDGWGEMPAFLLAGHRFNVGHEVQAALEDGRRYRVHYLRTAVPTVTGVYAWPLILSLEEVPSASSAG